MPRWPSDEPDGDKVGRAPGRLGWGAVSPLEEMRNTSPCKRNLFLTCATVPRSELAAATCWKTFRVQGPARLPARRPSRQP
jgi:hypothetical protein